MLVGAGAGLVGHLAACGDDDGGGTDAGVGGTDGSVDRDAGGGTDAGGGSCDSTSATIGTNHGHTLMVPAADVAAGTMQTYDIQGTSPHPHTITLTATDFAMLQAGMPVTVDSSLDARHTHQVTVMCA